MYKVLVLNGLQRVLCIIYPSLVDDSNSFAIGYVLAPWKPYILRKEAIYIENN